MKYFGLNITNKIKSFTVFLLGIMIMAILSGCNSKIETNFVNGNADSATMPEESETEDVNVTANNSVGNSSQDISSNGFDEDIEFDLDELPDNITEMVKLCDAINIHQYESGVMYNAKNAEFVWDCIHIAVGNEDWRNDEVTIYDEAIVVPSNIVKEYGYAMFGEVGELPNIPNKLIDEKTCYYSSNALSNDFSYCFSLGDRGLSTAEVRKAIMHPDTTVTLEVALVDPVDEKEICDFEYSLRTNIRDLSTAAKFQYEIVSSRAVSEKTISRMAGIPYVVFSTQVYGNKIYSPNDPKYNEIIEIPYFSSVKESAELKKLNDRIVKELVSIGKDLAVEEGEEEFVQWAEIKSYPVSNSRYIQVVTSYQVFPDYGSHGDIVTYNYDLNNKYAINLAYAYVLAGTSKEEIADKVKAGEFGKYGNDGKYSHCECQGFLIREDGSFDFYLKAYFDSKTDGEPFDVLGVINSKTGKLKLFDMDEDLVESQLVDVQYPPLTHGKDIE